MENEKTLKKAGPSTIHEKFLVGYQGWFTCAGDGDPIDPGHHGWLHWFNFPIPHGGHPCIDLWPDTSECSQSELYPAPGLTYKNGQQAFLFSSRNPKTVQRHFHWMARHGVDGAFLQRFAGQCDLDSGRFGMRHLRDEIGDRVREAAEKEGRVFAIMYDVSGVPADRIAKVIETDWIHLLREKCIIDSPSYLRERGKPVVALWGFGFHERHHTPEVVRRITNFIRQSTPGGAYIMAGTPAHWRTATEDADRDPKFLDVWLEEFDAISPWMVGRLRNNEDVDTFADYTMKFDVEMLRKRHEQGKRKVDYIPVVYPGFSGLNLSEGRGELNGVKRDGGRLSLSPLQTSHSDVQPERFFWKQIFNAKRLGVRTMYGAMWDEYDEGTAFMPVVEKARLLPEGGGYPFLALDADGYDLPSDWYMRICGFAAEGLRSERMIHETFPSKELQDYWSSRPRYEDTGKQSNTGEGSSGQPYEDWLQSQKETKDELPPPPYSLEAEEVPQSQPSNPSTSVDASLTPTPNTSNQSQVHATDVTAPAHQATVPNSSSTNFVPQPSAPHSQGADMTTLTDDFARQGISAVSQGISPQVPVTTSSSFHSSHSTPASSSPGPSSRPPVSPPPLHPQSRPRPNLASRPSSRPRPPEQTKPQSQASGRLETVSPGSAGLPSGPHFPSPQPQEAWAPSDWGANRPPSQQVQYQPYQRPSPLPQSPIPNSGDGAQSYRPHGTPSPQQHSNYSIVGDPSSLRPHTSPSPSSSYFPTGTPHHQHSLGNAGGSNQSPVHFPQPEPNNSSVSASLGRPVNVMNSYSPPITPSPMFPQAGPSQSQQHDVAHPIQHHPHPPYHQNPYDSNPYPASPGPSPYHTPEHHTNYGSAEQSYPSYGPGPGPRPSMAPAGNGGYRPSYIQPSHQGPSPSSWPLESQVQSNVPPPPPPRPVGTPAQHQPAYPGGYTSVNTPSSSSSSMPGNFPGSAAFGYALNAVDRVAGRKTRDQLESQLGNIAQTGGKLFSKFTK
ncbi:xylosidase arabinosidase [Moniliophthora roreri]|nr:xylosidase arabinosidase [Moniliophthora roreri]